MPEMECVAGILSGPVRQIQNGILCGNDYCRECSYFRVEGCFIPSKMYEISMKENKFLEDLGISPEKKNISL